MTKFIALVSGKGGVGKTTATINLGHALTKLGKNTLILDANLSTPNLALNLGLTNPKKTLNGFLQKREELKEIIQTHKSGINFIPTSPSYSELLNTNMEDITEIFEHLENHYEFVLVDCPSGLKDDLSHVLMNTDEALIVVNPNLSSVMDALKTTHLAEAHNNTIAGVLLNKTNKGKHELKPQEVEEILGHKIIGNIRTDKKIRKALHLSSPLNHLYPRSKSAKTFQKIAEHLSLNDELNIR